MTMNQPHPLTARLIEIMATIGMIITFAAYALLCLVGLALDKYEED